MKKVIALLLVLILGVSMLAGCGGKEEPESPAPPSSFAPESKPGESEEADDPGEDTPPADEFVDKDYFSYTAVGDWYVDTSTSDRLENEVIAFPFAFIEIKWRIMEPERLIETVIMPPYPSLVPQDDLTVAGITYYVLVGERDIFLVAPLADADDGSIEIHILYTDIEGAMPVLETIILK